MDVLLSIVSSGGRSTSRSDKNAASVNLSAPQWYTKKSAKFYMIKLIHHPRSVTSRPNSTTIGDWAELIEVQLVSTREWLVSTLAPPGKNLKAYRVDCFKTSKPPKKN